jgi:branched-chain amino acid aminotransferase
VKTTDRFANLKSASFLPYALAARAARKNKWTDALLLNSFGRVADSSIANVFLIKDGRIKTPALSEGCVDGVLRRWLLEKLPAWNYKVEETTVSTAELVNADEVFLTNSVRGIRWVGALEEKMYSYALTSEIFQHYSQTIFQ